MGQAAISFELIFVVVTSVMLLTQTNFLQSDSPGYSLRAEAEQVVESAPVISLAKVPELEEAVMAGDSEEVTKASEAAVIYPTATLIPTTKPIPTPLPEPTSEPAPQSTNPQTTVITPTIQETRPSLVVNSLLGEVNSYRKTQGKSELGSRDDLCTVTSERAVELQNDFSHAGFQNRLNNGSFNQLNYSGLAENIFAGTSDVMTIVEGWKNSSGHNENMLGDYVWGCGKVEAGKAVFLFLR